MSDPCETGKASGKRATRSSKFRTFPPSVRLTRPCLLYTSDAADDQELKELQQAIQDGKLPDSAKQEKQGQFQAKLEAYQRRLADFNREIQQKQREMVAEYMKKVQAAAQVVGEKNGYVAIIDKGNDTTMKIVLYYQPALDLTDQVVKEFDRQNK